MSILKHALLTGTGKITFFYANRSEHDVIFAEELRDLQNDELEEHIKTARKEIFGLRFQHATGELENTSGMRSAKRELARALTVARERGIDIESIR